MVRHAFRFLIPLLSGGLIIAAAGVFIHLYRSTWTPTELLSPGVPRAQVAFSARLPDNHTSRPLPVLLRVVKDKNAYFSVNYWHAGRTVFQMPLLDPPAGQKGPPPSIRLALWDPGQYTLSFSDPQTGGLLRSTSFRVAAPLGLYRNDLILLLLLALAGYMSGRIATDSIPLIPETARHLSKPRLLFTLLSLGGLLLTFSAVYFSHGMESPAQDLKRTGFHESEGRADAPRMLLPISSSEGRETRSYLIIRHRLDSWLRFGQELTFFEGPVDRGAAHHAFILPPDDGGYRLSFWSGGGNTLSESHVTVNAIPVSPTFPLGLFSGLTLFSSSFFLLGITGSRRAISGAMTERLR